MVKKKSEKKAAKKTTAVRRGPPLKGPVTTEDWEVFDSLCKIQCTLHEIAAFFDCDHDTIQARVNEKYHRKFSEVFAEKRLKGCVSLRRKQFEKAMSGNIKMLEFLGKQYLNQSDKNHTAVDFGNHPINQKIVIDVTRLTTEQLEAIEAAAVHPQQRK